MGASLWSTIVLCMSLFAAAQTCAQAPVGALANDDRQGDQYGWAMDYETADAARAGALRGAARGARWC